MKHKPKKSLGQNFLINPKVAERIALDADISKKDVVLEIGPGTGYLTKYLLMRAKKVIAIEKDNNLAKDLEEKFKKEVTEKKLIIIVEDVLKIDPLLISPLAGGEKIKIVANIPYNITGAILKKFLTEKNKPSSMTLMVQKEVAERIIARDGKESLLSISVKVYGEPKILFKVSRGNFYPSPNVDSAIIMINNISSKAFNSPLEEYPKGEVDKFSTPSRKRTTPQEGNLDEDLFWEILRAGFAHKRKKLSSNLKIYDPLLLSPLAGGEKAPMTRRALGFIDLGNKRAEELHLTDWINLAKKIQPHLTSPYHGRKIT
ncbi:MAG: 16S rRNA (adenine(1518)-N(6)/adenine(1519)-N(6))-dimethyltransferase RsmA [Candidatus Paceibacterota bacterium]